MESARSKPVPAQRPPVADAPASPPPRRRFVRIGLSSLAAALAVELADELVDGTKSAAMPLIRHDLTLNYLQIGLLAAVPLVVGSILELPVGVISGAGPRRRRRLILSGGLVFIASVLAAGLATSFAGLVVALTIFFPASGMFVSLTQAALMDAAPDRQAQHMARWTLAGSIGAVTGPILVAVVLGAGGTWRLAFILVAGLSAAAWCAVAWTGRAGKTNPHHGNGAAAHSAADGDAADDPAWPGWRTALSIVRDSGALRWLMLLEVADLLLDVLTPFLALYLVAVLHVAPSVAALGIAVRLGAGLAGDVLLIRALDRLDRRTVIRAASWATLALFPAFLLVPGLGLKLVVLAALTIATTPWYPVLQAELYGSLPGRSGLAVSLTSVAGLVGALGPLAVGLLAQRFGLTAALASLCIVPVLMLAVPAGRRDGS
jgi:MFS transporter, FSR family, fosmidomycin resistance protein